MNLKKKHRREKLLNRILMIVFLGVFLFSLYKVVGIIREYRQIDQFYENANRNFVQLEKRSLPKVDFETLQEVNKDVIAWIYIEDADISFPVLQGKTNKQYLFQSLEDR